MMLRLIFFFYNAFWAKLMGIKFLLRQYIIKKQLAECGKNVQIVLPLLIHNSYGRIHMADNTNIYSGFKFISYKGHFYMRKNSGAAQGLTVITGNHGRDIGVFFKEHSINHTSDIEKDVIVEEDVWIGANVTLLAGVKIGRGATVGANSVCVKSVPPYSIVMGNPAKVVGFNFNPEEVLEHEKALYAENERISLDILEKNYSKFYIGRINEIKLFLKQ